MMTDLSPKIPYKFYCELCDYSTSNKKDYMKHKMTLKHKNNDKIMTNNDAISQKIPKSHICNCGKKYTYRQGLYLHKQKCNFVTEEKEETNKYHLDKSQDLLKAVREEEMEETAPYPRLNLQQMEDLNKTMDMINKENMMSEEDKMTPVNKFKNSNLESLIKSKMNK